MSASFHWIAWKSAIRRPNCSRSSAYARATSYAACAMPSACAAIPMRPPSSVAIATRKPRPSSYRSRSRSTCTSSSMRSDVVEELSPSFSSSRVTVTCAASRTKQETPRAPAVSGSVRAKSTNVPARDPFVIHCFEPFSFHPSSAGSADVRSEPASEPDPDSVRANAPICSPRASGGTNRDLCSSVPNVRIGRVVALVCTATVTPTPASALESSSRTRMYERKSAPAPPYSSGTHTPMRPSSASFG